MSKFEVGDEVVCEQRTEGVHNYIVPNTIYTVTGVRGELVDIEGPPSAYCVERIEHGLVSKKKWKQGWNENWFKLVARESMKKNQQNTFVKKFLVLTI